MKTGNLIFLFLLFLLPAVMATAQDASASGGGNKLLDRRMEQRKIFDIDDVLTMQQESKSLTKEEKTNFFKKYSKPPVLIAGAVLLNVLLPTAGSFVIGDVTGATVSLTGFFVGGAMFAAGFAPIVTQSYENQNWEINVILAITGGAIVGISYLIGWVTPIAYCLDWNYKLLMGLRLLPFDRNNGSVLYEKMMMRDGLAVCDKKWIELPLAVLRF